MSCPPSDDGEPSSNWVLGYEHFDPDLEGLREALCTLANGYFDDLHVTPPGTLGDRVAVSWATRPSPRTQEASHRGERGVQPWQSHPVWAQGHGTTRRLTDRVVEMIHD
jgi:hypothetical protein